jgi:DNA-binding XRE family transcriptional regulator|tara:strand:+ start:363 stop:764 length:402 start_codon:yes stop_codon:yes gene_type:complete
MKRVDYGYADLSTDEIRDLRKELGMSQAKLSKKVGVSLRTYCHYEYGTQRMPVSVHMAIKFLLNNGDKMEEAHEKVKNHENLITKYDMERINRLRKAMKECFLSIKDQLDPLPAKMMVQSEKEMGFLLSKINN